MSSPASTDATFTDALERLLRGDFSRLERLFDERTSRSGKPQIVEWHEQGRFRDQPQALAEALTCASFLGRTGVAVYLLKQGVNPSGGAGTGLDVLHWAANRGQLEAVRPSSAPRLRSKREACMAAQRSARRSGPRSMNREVVICRLSKSCLMRVRTWKMRITPQGTNTLTRSSSVTDRGDQHARLNCLPKLAPRASMRRLVVVKPRSVFVVSSSSFYSS